MRLTIEEIDEIREHFPIGCWVRAVAIHDTYQCIPSGTYGKVSYIDGTGTIFVDWQNGISLGALPEIDTIERVIPQTQSDKQ